MSDPTIAEDEIRLDDASTATEGMTVSRALSGPLAALGAIRYELGPDQVWVIGRLPELVSAHSSGRRRTPVRRSV